MDAITPVMRAIEKLGGKPELRMGVKKLDQLSLTRVIWLLIKFDTIDDPAGLEKH